MDAQFTGMTDVARPSVGKSLAVSRVSLAVWIVILAFAVTAFVGLYAAGLTVDWASGATILPIVPVCAGLAWYYRARRPDLWISSSCDAVAQLILILILSALCTYAAAAVGMPLRDSEFFAIDQWLGFDWLSYNDFHNARPWLATASAIAYSSILPQADFTLAVLAATRRFARLNVFLLALELSLAITIAISAVIPAVGCYAFFGVTAADFPNLSPQIDFVPQMVAIRSSAFHVIRFDDFQGLIMFPSFHACAAITAIWTL
jgi:hypothetical protein